MKNERKALGSRTKELKRKRGGTREEGQPWRKPAIQHSLEQEWLDMECTLEWQAGTLENRKYGREMLRIYGRIA